eukprot:Skav232361  [mRNA]  locus=scaffold1062:208639:224820:- [translate_table: standard]
MFSMTSVLASLQLLIKCLASSRDMLFWSFCLLTVVQGVACLIVSTLIRDFVENERLDLQIRNEVYQYYGTFTRSFLTMLESPAPIVPARPDLAVAIAIGQLGSRACRGRAGGLDGAGDEVQLTSPPLQHFASGPGFAVAPDLVEEYADMVRDEMTEEERAMAVDGGDDGLRRRVPTVRSPGSSSGWEDVGSGGYVPDGVVIDGVPYRTTAGDAPLTEEIAMVHTTMHTVHRIPLSLEERVEPKLTLMRVAQLQELCVTNEIAYSNLNKEALVNRLHAFYGGQAVPKRGSKKDLVRMSRLEDEERPEQGLILPKAQPKPKARLPPQHPEGSEALIPPQFRVDRFTEMAGFVEGLPLPQLPCPKCQAPMVGRVSSRDGGKFYGCSRFPTDGCKGTMKFEDAFRRFRRTVDDLQQDADVSMSESSKALLRSEADDLHVYWMDEAQESVLQEVAMVTFGQEDVEDFPKPSLGMRVEDSMIQDFVLFRKIQHDRAYAGEQEDEEQEPQIFGSDDEAALLPVPEPEEALEELEEAERPPVPAPGTPAPATPSNVLRRRPRVQEVKKGAWQKVQDAATLELLRRILTWTVETDRKRMVRASQFFKHKEDVRKAKKTLSLRSSILTESVRTSENAALPHLSDDEELESHRMDEFDPEVQLTSPPLQHFASGPGFAVAPVAAAPFEIMFANWGPPCRVLVDNVSEWFSAFFLFYRCVLLGG